MAREKEGFREQLDRLDAAFPGREIIRRTELAQFLGISYDTVKRQFKAEYNQRMKGYAKVTVARALVE